MKKLLLFLLLFTSITFSQWQLRNNGLPLSDNMAWDLDAIDQNNAVIATTKGIYKTTDAGNNWQLIKSGNAYCVSMASNSIIYAETLQEILKTTDGGTTWTTMLQLASNSGYFNYMEVFGDTIVTMADADYHDSAALPQFLKSTNAGTTWVQLNKSYFPGGVAGTGAHQIDYVTPNLCFYFYHTNSSKGNIYKTTDGGATWTDTGLATNASPMKMHNQTYGIVAGWDSGNFFFNTDNGGFTWDKVEVSFGTASGDMEFVPNKPVEVFALMYGGLFYSADSGKTWSQQNFAGVQGSDIKFVDENCGWILTHYTCEVYWTNNKGNAVVSAEKESQLPTQYILEQNYPNPFNPTTKISFALPEAGRVTIKIYDMLGREINTLVNSEMSAGTHSVNWNGDNALGQKAATGIYLYSISTNKFTQTKKMVLLK